MCWRPSPRRTYSTKSVEFARRTSPVRWSSHLRPDEPGTKWTRSPPRSACGLPSRSYSQNDDGALAMARSTTSRGNSTRSPEAFERQPGLQQPAAHLLAADLHAGLGEHALGFVDDPGDEVVREDGEGGSHQAGTLPHRRGARGSQGIAWDEGLRAGCRGPPGWDPVRRRAVRRRYGRTATAEMACETPSAVDRAVRRVVWPGRRRRRPSARRRSLVNPPGGTRPGVPTLATGPRYRLVPWPAATVRTCPSVMSASS